MVKYLELAAECWEADWKTFMYPVEVGCRGYMGLSRLLKDAPEKGNKRACRGGREREHVALVEEEGQVLRKR